MISIENAERFAALLAELELKPRVEPSALTKAMLAARNDLKKVADESAAPEIQAAADRIAALFDAQHSEVHRSLVVDQADGLMSLDSTARISTPFPGLEAPLRGDGDRIVLGPFQDMGRQDRFFGLMPQTKWQAIGLENSNDPILLVPQGSVTEGRELAFEVQESTIWLAVSATQEEPDKFTQKQMIGLSVREANGSFASIGGFVLRQPLTGKMSLRLSYPEEKIEVCDGVVLTAPEEMVMTWEDGKLSIEISPGTVAIGNTEITFEPTGGPPVYDATLHACSFLPNPATASSTLTCCRTRSRHCKAGLLRVPLVGHYPLPVHPRPVAFL